MPVLDTSFLIDLEQGLPAAVRAMGTLDSQPLTVPFQAATEYLAGTEAPESGLDLLQCSYEVSTPTTLHLLAAARLAKGTRRPQWGDIHIAAVALTLGTYVVTADAADFASLGCRVWDYRNQDKPPT